MPNYSFVVNATYDPLTFEEIERVPLRAAAFHSALQDKYDEAKMTTQMYDMLIPKDDPEYARSRAALDEYLNALNSGADALMNNGAWGQRDVLSGVRDIYGKRMMPVINAWTKRDEQEKEQRALLAKNPLLKFSRRASATGLDSYLDNPYLSYEQMDPSVAANMVNTMVKSLQARLNSDENFKNSLISQGVDPATIAHIQQFGLTPDMIPQWRDNSVLRNIMGTALRAQGMDLDEKGYGKATDVWDAPTTESVIPALETALWGAVGPSKAQFDADPTYMAQLKAATTAASGSGTGANGAYTGPWLPNDHSLTVGDSLTDGSELDKLQNAAAMLGIRYDKDTNKFTYDPHTFSGGIDALQGRFSNAIPWRRSADEIFTEVAEANGWTYTSVPGSGAAGMFTDKGKPVSKERIAQALEKQAEKSIGRYHTLQDISLSDYNNAFKGMPVFHVQKINKDGSYYTDEKKKTTISAVLADKDVDGIQVGVSSTVTNNGIMLIVSKGGKQEHYFIKTDSIRDGNVKAAVEAVNRASQKRDGLMKQMGITSDEWYMLVNQAYQAQQPSDILNAQLEYRNAVRALQGAIGGSNSIATLSLGN